MKKTLLSITCCFAFILSTQAQTLYGLTGSGGADGGGALIKFISATNNLTVDRSFESPALYPQSGLIQANNGKLYGTTSGGGSCGNGTIFSFDPSSSTLTKLKSFCGTDGAQPVGSLVQANDGKLYGTTSGGGSSGVGVIFSFDPSTSTYSKLMDFVSINDVATNGRRPNGGLVQASDGKLYGMTNEGGSNYYGVIFSFDPSTSTYSKLMDFGGANGGRPEGSLMLANDGKLYGMTLIGGKYWYQNDNGVGHGHGGYRTDNAGYRANNDGYGVIFSFNPRTSAYKKLVDFDVTNGDYPKGNLMQASDGKLYGTTSAGGSNFKGVIFSYTLSPAKYTKLIDFDGTNGNNYYGSSSLIQASDGKLYGMTPYGGSSDKGVIFSFAPSSSTYTILKNFDGTDDTYPGSNFVQASNGNLYSISGGGGSGYGVVYSFAPSTSINTKLIDFGVTDGSYPSGSLVQASNGKLYSMTSGGGSSGYGVIFSFDPSTSTYTKLIDFNGTNGNNYYDGYGNYYGYYGLILASDGKLYGMTHKGGSSDGGVIFSYDPSSSTYTKLIDFDGTNGSSPVGSLMQASDGKLYGVTAGGGSSGGGVIFSFALSSSTYTKLYDFDFINGIQPNCGLVQANNGKLYGATFGGGSSNGGVVFSFDPSISIYSTLKNFNIYSGDFPLTGSMVQASNGKLYGMMSGGNYGSIFSLDPSSSIFTKLKFFDYNDINGSNPSGSLMQASDGKLYGMTYGGGSNNLGVIFSFDPSTSAYTKLQDFNGTNGSSPAGSFIELSLGVLPTTRASFSGKNIGNNVHDAIEIMVAPNPVFNSASVSFTIPQSQHVSLKLFDANGKMIKVLADTKFEKGQYKVQWNTAEVSAGIYFLRFDAGAYSKTKKLSVIK